MNSLLRLPSVVPTHRLFTRLGRTLAVITALLLLNRPAAAELIVNGDFEAGNVGFTSAYTFSPSPGNINGPATYVIQTINPTGLGNFGDHTTGSGLYMAVNGATTANTVVWSQTVAVNSNTSYTFSAWAANMFRVNPANLDFQFNGTSVGTFTTPVDVGKWSQFVGSWNSGSATSLTISIIDNNLNFSGNDFALDDISLNGGLGTTEIAPEPSTLILFGIGAVGSLAGYFRRRKVVAE